MQVINGFNLAKKALSREVVTGLSAVSPAMKARLKSLFGTEDAEAVVARILDDVRKRSDAAVIDYTQKIDGIKLDSLAVIKNDIDGAYREVDASVVSALRLAAERVTAFHNAERDAIFGGLGQMGRGLVVRPLERVGVYIPGGTASYPSTVLMTAIPARAAGVGEIILVSPPRPNGKISPLVLIAADIAGVGRIFTAGGAQAVAAMAYGTESIPKVDKICGPGNVFVMLAKKQVYGTVDIDGLQGPSEVLIIADGKAKPAYVAADLIAQAEHDTMASAILITTSKELANEVNKELEKQLSDLPRKTIAMESLNDRGKIAVVDIIDEAIELANLYAPEHLCLMVEDSPKYADRIKNAGCVFVGENSAEVLGDYVAGPSHALPTGGTARFSSPLSVIDFIKFMNVVATDKSVSRRLWQAAAIIARAEGLEGHARSADKRLKKG